MLLPDGKWRHLFLYIYFCMIMDYYTRRVKVYNVLRMIFNNAAIFARFHSYKRPLTVSPGHKRLFYHHRTFNLYLHNCGISFSQV